ncbi:MAG: efflux RND transporter periplasmic adaptor subunit [Candidatus Marinimicrobia bacterium]|nr:efflux RND transporter periplasmic adaptor subunit [Candidatus Neomarinimicrobiota bacterium]RKY60683.1 MAG: secretion protein HlyD [Candidatus Neomarinimicrobiota bacterium]
MRRVFPIIFLAFLAGCSHGNGDEPVYNGRLEADMIKLSAKINGTIDKILVNEGDSVQKGDLLALINTARYEIQRQQQIAQLEELRLNLRTLDDQMRQVQPQLKLIKDKLGKISNLVENGAATEQDRDDLEAQVEILTAKLDGFETNREIIISKEKQLQAAIDLTDLNIRDARIEAPIDGMIINSYREPAELAAAGTVLFDVADLSSLEATIYVPLTDLNKIKIGQTAHLMVDGMDKTFDGKIKWIASESEFTPKTIMTQETRATLVYAVKITVPNPDGILKIGMPVDVTL